MTKTSKQILERVYNKGFNDRCQQEKYADIDNQFVVALSVDQALKELEAIISERPIHHHPEHMAYMHTRELDWLKRLQMHEGVLMYNTGVILQPVSDRIQMYEDMFARRPDTYKKVTALYGKEAEL